MREATGEEWYTEQIESGFETQKKHTIKAFFGYSKVI